jgi:hypothetical protein
MSTRRISLTRYEPEYVNFTHYSAYRLRIEVSDHEGDDIDPFVFIYRREPIDPYTEQQCDTFCAVIGPSQYATIPAGSPDPERSYPFFRLSYVELDFISRQEALDFWELIQQEVCILVNAMGKLTQLVAVETVHCPSPPEDVSESASDSV